MTELRYALVCEKYRGEKIRQIERCRSFVESDERMAKLVKSLSEGLALIGHFGSEKYVRFMHQTVYDFLRYGGFSMLLPPESAELDSSHTTLLAIGHDALSKACVSYLTSAEVLEGIRGWGRGDEKLFPLIQYAAKFSREHAAKSESWGKPQEDYIELLSTSEDVLSLLAELHNQLVRRVWPFEIIIGSKLLNIAGASGLSSIVQTLLRNGEQPETGSMDVTPLHCAARWGHSDIVKLLLEAGADITAKTSNGKTPIELAAANSHTDIVRRATPLR